MELFKDSEDASDLKLEPAAFVDGRKRFVTAIYYLERDGPLVFTCYQQLAGMAQSVGIGSYPRYHAIALQRADGDHNVFSKFMSQAKSYIRPAYQYCLEKVNIDFHDVVRAFRSARL